MDVFSLLSYINKVSLLAFFVTTIVVGYQIYILKKEKSKEQKPSIPDFKDMARSNEAKNYTQLPNNLLAKETKQANYSKLVFSTISLLTVMVVIFIIFLIRRNNGPVSNQAVTPTNTQKNGVSGNKSLVLNNVSPTLPATSPTTNLPVGQSPTPKPSLSPTPDLSPTPSLSPSQSLSPTLAPTTEPSVSPTITLMPSPTEIILAQANPTISGAPTGTQGAAKPQTLPVTGGLGKGLILIGTAISAIFLSFLF